MLNPVPLPIPYGLGITVDNVNEALPLGLDLVKQYGVPRVSRGMPYIEVPGPVLTLYRNPQRRVLFDEVRDANPFFHLMESLWIIAGSDRVDLPQYFLSSITRFSDDGVRFHGAYGHRLRKAFGFDQINAVVDMLINDPDTRQAVLSIWHPQLDLAIPTKDMPCNDMVMLGIRDGYLHMTVCNRSNDVIWGAYGANAVQFAMLHEFLAARIGVNVGYYLQQSNSFHVYPDNPFWLAYQRNEHDSGHVHNPYMHGDVDFMPVALGPEEALMFEADCVELDRRATEGISLTAPVLGYSSEFFHRVVVPMITGYDYYKKGDYHQALTVLRYVNASDWRLACTAWVLRRKERAEAKKMKGAL